MITRAAILAGGEARRMGGGDKPLKLLGGKPILSSVLARLRPQLDEKAPIMLSCNSAATGFTNFNLTIRADSVLGSNQTRLGPLAGIFTALEWAQAENAQWLLTIAGDTPFFPLTLLEQLQTKAAKTGAEIILAASYDTQDILRYHPTFGLWSTALATDLQRALTQEKIRKIVAWADRHKTSHVAFKPFMAGQQKIDPFFNINTIDELKQAESIIAALKGALP